MLPPILCAVKARRADADVARCAVAPLCGAQAPGLEGPYNMKAPGGGDAEGNIINTKNPINIITERNEVVDV